MTAAAASPADAVLGFLHAVRRRMQMQQLADALQGAARVSLVLVLVLVALHFAVRALSGIWLMLGLALPALAGVCITVLRRPDIGRAARHADRALGGHSGFATCLEFLIERRGAPSAAALAALENWIGSALGPAQERLQRQHIRGIRETLVTVTSASFVALAAAVLPGRESAPSGPLTSAAVDARTATARVAPQPDSTAALQRALRAARVPDAEPIGNPAQRATAAAPPRMDGTEARPAERPRSPDSARGAGGDGEGRNAGAGAAAALTRARGANPRSALQGTIVREIHARHPAASGAAGTSPPVLAASVAALAEAMDFDRRQMALARAAGAARMDARAQSLASGPAAAALLRRWSQPESSQ